MNPEKIEDTKPAQVTAIPENKTQENNNQAENAEEINWRKFRQQREEERKQREAAEIYARQKEQEANALKQAMEALVSAPAQRPREDEETEEQRIDKRVNDAILKREVEMEKKRIENEAKALPQTLARSFADFDQVCSPENLDYLDYHYPEISQPYRHLPDSFDKWAGIYKACKRFIPNKDAVKDMKKAETNLAKPQALSKPGMSQTGDHAPSSRLDQDRKDKNWQRMQKAMGKGGIG